MKKTPLISKLNASPCDYCQAAGWVKGLFRKALCYRCDGIGYLQPNGGQLDAKAIRAMQYEADKKAFVAVMRFRKAQQETPHWYDTPGKLRSNWRGD